MDKGAANPAVHRPTLGDCLYPDTAIRSPCPGKGLSFRSTGASVVLAAVDLPAGAGSRWSLAPETRQRDQDVALSTIRPFHLHDLEKLVGKLGDTPLCGVYE